MKYTFEVALTVDLTGELEVDGDSFDDLREKIKAAILDGIAGQVDRYSEEAARQLINAPLGATKDILNG